VQQKPTCIGTGLLALDAVINTDSNIYPQLYAGGSCGNVLSILAFLGWNALPVARLADNKASRILECDLKHWDVDTSFIEHTSTGSTPIIIHRILKDAQGKPKHKFEFKDPDNGNWLPQYKPLLAKNVSSLTSSLPKPSVFYFDRATRASIELAKFYKNQNSLIFFEPSANSDLQLFEEALAIAHVVKFSSDRIKNYQSTYPTSNALLEIETLGTQGLRYRTDRANATEWVSLPSFHISTVMDAAGAGDWTTAGFINYLFQGNNALLVEELFESPIDKYLSDAQALGALNCCYPGARGLMYNLTLEELTAQVSLIQDGDFIDNVLGHSISKSLSNVFTEKLSSLYN
jgi:sugar/nucleoside kinase (ribokinase family)